MKRKMRTLKSMGKIETDIRIVVINGNENHMRYIFTLTKMAKV